MHYQAQLTFGIIIINTITFFFFFQIAVPLEISVGSPNFLPSNGDSLLALDLSHATCRYEPWAVTYLYITWIEKLTLLTLATPKYSRAPVAYGYRAGQDGSRTFLQMLHVSCTDHMINLLSTEPGLVPNITIIAWVLWLHWSSQACRTNSLLRIPPFQLLDAKRLTRLQPPSKRQSWHSAT